MADATYQPKVYRKQGGSELVVASGGKINIESGGTIEAGGVDLIDELAALSGLDATELGYLNAVTAGTVAASKAVVVDANKDAGDFRNLDAVNIDAGGDAVAGTVDIFPATTARGKIILQCADNATAHNLTITNAALNGAHKTATFPNVTGYVAESTAALSLAETDVLDDAVAGTVVASKAVVVDANKDVGDFRNLDAVNIDAGASGTAGTVDIFPTTGSKGKIIIQCADNATNHNLTITNEALNGASKTATFPAVTGYVAESTAALTLAEVDVLDAVTAGTASASKAAVLGADKNLDVLAVADLKLGAGAGTSITADATQLNSCDANVGAAAGTGVVAVETGFGNFKTTTLTFTDTPVVLADEAGVVAYGGLKVYDMPQGYIYTQAAVANLALTKSSAGVNVDWDGDIGVGTVTASNNNTLTGTEANIIPSTATPQAVAGATTGDAVSTATEHAILDGTSAAVDVFVNLLVDDADHDVTSTPCNLILNGTLTLAWIFMGDN